MVRFGLGQELSHQLPTPLPAAGLGMAEGQQLIDFLPIETGEYDECKGLADKLEVVEKSFQQSLRVIFLKEVKIY